MQRPPQRFAPLLIYSLIQIVMVPLMALRAIWLVLRGTETWADARERLVGPRMDGPAIWLHGASLGELQSARPVIAALAPHGVMVTATRKPAVLAVRGWNIAGVQAGLAPLDLGFVTRRLLRHNNLNLLISLENELWPARMIAAHQMQVPVVMLSARMSQKSARLWQRFPQLTHRMLSPVAGVWPQDEGSVQRLAGLGVSADAMHPVVKLKSGYVAQVVPRAHPLPDWMRADTVLAAATHPGEEQVVLEAFTAAHRLNPALKLIIAPRHIDRAPDIARLIKDAGHAAPRRSQNEAPDGPIYLADTMGEMPLWYSHAGVAFVGGSLVPVGGHTPYEPAAYGCPILHGPHVANFVEDYASLDSAGAAKAVTSKTLAKAIMTHIDDAMMADKARACVQPPDIDAIVDAILNLRAKPSRQ